MLFHKYRLVGKDENGNSYYESSTGKRWVMYNKTPDPTTVQPNWHMWLHYSDDTLPVSSKKIHVKHAAGTIKNKNYYESWSPDN
ncbi:hypothetical protein BIY23_01410 [Wolbachia pipientis]|uniref:NADH:ubiquinone oxidoreductase n=1 Tax=Wolbachia pipientis TaxID=955 RepID=A0A1E7QLM8_WOLPI|nr:NADH-ubiquinone oxidoreductase subunit NDUFA12 family protein [Wolbachia pipientis]OEY87124.1 hypothetical protein BIY23_01410 [Wolbachia pipientis]